MTDRAYGLGADHPLVGFANHLRTRYGCGEVFRFSTTVQHRDPTSLTTWVDGAAAHQIEELRMSHVGTAHLATSTLLAEVGNDEQALGDALRLVPNVAFSLIVTDPGLLSAAVTGVKRSRGRYVFDGIAEPSSAGAGGRYGVVVAEGGAGLAHSVVRRPPDNFRVVAFVTVHNEEDIIGAALDDLESQGIEAYVIDNWSTDATREIVDERLGGVVCGVETYPPDNEPQYFDLRGMLERIEQLAGAIDADWFIKHDADEFRRSPWKDVTLRDGLYIAQSAGYNLVDFTVVNFAPTDDEFDRGLDPLTHFKYFEFGRNPGHFVQYKAWRNFGQDIQYANAASHRVQFAGARPFPYRFLLRHYPIRSNRHGQTKVFAERRERFLPEAKARGWHTHYDKYTPGESFIRDPKSLEPFNSEAQFRRKYLVERLSGMGIRRDQPVA